MAPAPRYTFEEEERLILDAAAKVIEESSILDFKMSAIASEAGISMGSVYKHVQCKEDIMIALVTRSMKEVFTSFQAVLDLDLSLAERCLAISVMDFCTFGLHPFDGHLQMLVTNEAVLAKGSDKWRTQLIDVEHQFEDVFFAVADDAFEAGELGGDDKAATLARLNYGLWALAAGFSQIHMQKTGFGAYSDAHRLPASFPQGSPQFQCIVDFINTFDWRHPLDQAAIDRVAALINENRLDVHPASQSAKQAVAS